MQRRAGTIRGPGLDDTRTIDASDCSNLADVTALLLAGLAPGPRCVHGRGIVTALDGLRLELDDPTSWQGCAVQSLKRVRFPVSETAGHVQVRLTLR